MSTPVSKQKKRAWETRFEKLTAAAQKAADDVLVGIYEAAEDGLSQADIAYMIGAKSGSIIKPKVIKGEEILLERKRR